MHFHRLEFAALTGQRGDADERARLDVGESRWNHQNETRLGIEMNRSLLASARADAKVRAVGAHRFDGRARGGDRRRVLGEGGHESQRGRGGENN